MILDEIVQVKEHPISATLFGKGKINELKELADNLNADTILIYNTLRSIQKVDLELLTKRKVLDRYDLTLEIFSINASDAVSKLQIELAKIQKEIPYMRILTTLRYQGDRPFIKAGGEYAWHPIIAELRRRAKRLREKIKMYREEKIRRIFERKDRGFYIVCIVGYYNAGKTTLFNKLTGEQKTTSEMPFTTLSSKYARLAGSEKILMVDTIGFVVDLDPRIIKSFEINIDDMRYSDLIILVIDVSDKQEWLQIKLETSIDILKENGALRSDKPFLIALNKVDLIFDELDFESKKQFIADIIKERVANRNYQIVPISAYKGWGLDELVISVTKLLNISNKLH